MFISKQKGLIFFHVPKTGGTSIKDFLHANCEDGNFLTSLTYDIFCKKPNLIKFKVNHKTKNYESPDYSHLSQKESLEILKEFNNLKLENFTEFVLVRNPYNRLVSYFNFILHKQYKTIDLFLDDLEKDKVDPLLYFRGQMDYISNPITKNFKVFKYEDIGECEKFLQEFLNTEMKLPNKNVTKKQFVNLLNDTTKSRYYNMFKDEFHELGYNK